MRKATVRSGLRFLAFGVACVMLATFYHARIASLLMLGFENEARFTFLGFFLGGALAGFGVLTVVYGLVQSGHKESRVRLYPTLLFLISLVILFFVLAYSSISSPPAPRLHPGESISI